MNSLQRLSYRLNSGKNSKLLYYLRGYSQFLAPTPLLRQMLPHLLREARQRPDYEYLLDRVNYYCQLHEPVALPSSLPLLSEHRPTHPKVYFFDTHEFTRYFPANYHWGFCPGDVTYVPEVPSIVKSRPLSPDNENSVVMKLDKVRHFIRISDPIPFREKEDRLIFMGKVPGKEIREDFMRKYCGHPMVMAGDVSGDPSVPEVWHQPKMTLREHLQYKFVLALEGIDVASNLKWVMGSNSLAVMPEPTCETWFMEGRLVPNYHYVRINADFSDLESQLAYYIEHPNEAEQIIRNAQAYTQQFWDKRREYLISLMVLDKYFAYTGQREHFSLFV